MPPGGGLAIVPEPVECKPSNEGSPVIYVLPPLVAAWIVFRRRDVAS
jgi:hypothetical protein